MQIGSKIESIRVGCDLVYIPRFIEMLEKNPAMLERIFTVHESKDTPFESLAGIFAAKEALVKACGIAPGHWKQIEIIKKKDGRPEVSIDGYEIDISVSHDGEYAFAVAICY